MIGLVQFEKLPPSSLQRKAAPESSSVNEKVAFVAAVTLGGPEVIVGGGGGVRSIVHA